MTDSQRFPLHLLLRIFIPFALGYFLSFLYRVVNNVIAGDLTRDLSIDAGQLGLLTSAYLISFAAFQLPLGILLDRYGSRRVEAFLLVFAAIGAIVFALAQSLSGLVLGRALIGFGVSACLMAALRAFVQWFPAEKLPVANGLHLAAGGLGILAATRPVEFALQFMDWRGVFMILAVLTLGVAALIFFIVPEKPNSTAQGSFKEQLAGIKQIFTSATFWQSAPWSFTTQGASGAIMGLWAGPWLRDVALLDRAASVAILSWMAAGVMAGYFMTGFVAERLVRLGISLARVSAIGMICFMLVQVGIILELTQVATLLWILFGFFSTMGALTYAQLSQAFPKVLAGRVNTALNMLVFVFAFTAQWCMGEIIKSYSATGSATYAPQGYQTAFAIVLSIQVLGMLFYLYKPKTKKPI